MKDNTSKKHHIIENNVQQVIYITPYFKWHNSGMPSKVTFLVI